MTFITGVAILISVIALIVGLIKPSLVICWGDEESKTRKKVVKIYLLVLIIAMILRPVQNDSVDKTTTSETNNQVVSETKSNTESTAQDNQTQQPQQTQQTQNNQQAQQTESNNLAKWGDKATVKSYLEKTQPFAVTDFIQSQAGITGPLANGEVKALATHAFFMDAMAQRASKDIPKYGEIARQVAIYFDCESKIAQFYYNLKKDNKNTLDKVVGVIGTGAQTPDAYKQQSAAEDEIEAAAKWCGADLSSFYEQEAIKLFLKSLKQ